MAAMALLWLVFINCFLMLIQAQRPSYPMTQIPITDADIGAVNFKAEPGSVTGIFPLNLFLTPCVPPPGQSHVDEINDWYNSNKEALEKAKVLLESRDPTPENVDWKVTLYQLSIAYIVNFRDSEDGPEPPVSLKWIEPAARVFGLEYIAFTDLSLVPMLPFPGFHSGPFCGVFVSRDVGKSFMILSFKGTSNELEAATNALVLPTEQTDGTLYNQAVHMGMYNGLFIKFPNISKPAIDIIWEGLEREATNLGGTVENPVPLYVSGHSLGAGYAQLAYVELFRRLDASSFNLPFNLSSLYAFAAPRVSAIKETGFANKVHEVFEGSDKPIFRFSNEHDVVPFAPGILTVRGPSGLPDDNVVASGWVHLDGGHILHRDRAGPSGKYFTNEASERCVLPKGDPDGHSCWEYHFPGEYYRSIKKILDSNYTAGPPSPLEYNINGNCIIIGETCRSS